MAKIWTIMLVAAVVLTGCFDDEDYRSAAPAGVAKKIVMKTAPVEQRMGFDLFAKESFKQKTVTVYYLVAEDGTVCEVGLSDFATVATGDTYTSSSWVRK